MNNLENNSYQKLLKILSDQILKLNENSKSLTNYVKTIEEEKINLDNIVVKLTTYEAFTEEEVTYIKSIINNSIISKEELEKLLCNLPFVKWMNEFLSEGKTVDKIFKEQYDSFININNKLLKWISTYKNNFAIKIQKNISSSKSRLEENNKRIQIINNLIEYLTFGNNKINKEDFELLIKLLEEDNTLTDSEKKELLLDFSIYLYKQVEKKQAAIKKLEEEVNMYKFEEKLSKAYESETSEELKNTPLEIENLIEEDTFDEEFIDVDIVQGVNEEELKKQKKELMDIITPLYDYLDKVYNIALSDDININYDVEGMVKKFDSSLTYISNQEYNEELEKQVKYIIGDNIDKLQTHIFNISFQLYYIIKNDFQFVLDLYNKIENIEEFINSLNDLEKIEEYKILFEEAYKYLEMSSLSSERSKYEELILFFKTKTIEPNNFKNIGENMLVFVPETLDASFKNMESNINLNEYSETIKESLRIMRDKNYSVLAQGNNSRDKRVVSIKGEIAEALEDEDVYARRYRKNDIRTAFIPLNVSKKVQEIINEHFGYKIVSNNRILLVFGIECKSTSSDSGYKMFNLFLGKMDRNKNKRTIIKNPEIFNIIELFKLDNPTKKEIDKIIEIITNGDKIYSSIMYNEYIKELK